MQGNVLAVYDRGACAGGMPSQAGAPDGDAVEGCRGDGAVCRGAFLPGNLLLPASEVKEVIRYPGREYAARLDPFMGKLLVVALNLSLRDHYEPGETLPQDGKLYINRRCVYLIRDKRGREYRVDGFIGSGVYKGPIEYLAQYYFISDGEVREVDWLFNDLFERPFYDLLNNSLFNLTEPVYEVSENSLA